MQDIYTGSPNCYNTLYRSNYMYFHIKEFEFVFICNALLAGGLHRKPQPLPYFVLIKLNILPNKKVEFAFICNALGAGGLHRKPQPLQYLVLIELHKLPNKEFEFAFICNALGAGGLHRKPQPLQYFVLIKLHVLPDKRIDQFRIPSCCWLKWLRTHFIVLASFCC